MADLYMLTYYEIRLGIMLSDQITHLLYNFMATFITHTFYYVNIDSLL